MTYVKINDIKYPATINGSMRDAYWDNRQSKSINLEMDYATAAAIFVNGISWSIVQTTAVNNGNEIMEYIEEFDNSDYNLAGDITDHRDGTVTVKMGKFTELEEAYEIILGGTE